MDNKKIKIAIIVAVVVIVIISIMVVLMGSRKNKISNQQNTNVPAKTSVQKETEKYDVQNVVGKIVSIDENVENIKFELKDGRKLSLVVRVGAVSIIKQGQQKDGSFVNEAIGVFDVPKDQDVKIQYNAKNNELIMIVVDKF